MPFDGIFPFLFRFWGATAPADLGEYAFGEQLQRNHSALLVAMAVSRPLFIGCGHLYQRHRGRPSG